MILKKKKVTAPTPCKRQIFVRRWKLGAVLPGQVGRLPWPSSPLGHFVPVSPEAAAAEEAPEEYLQRCCLCASPQPWPAPSLDGPGWWAPGTGGLEVARWVVVCWFGSSFCKRMGSGVVIRKLFLQEGRETVAGAAILQRWLLRQTGRAAEEPFCFPFVWGGAECCRGDNDLDADQRYSLRRIPSSAGSGPRGGLGWRSGFGRLLSLACSETARLGLPDFPGIPSLKVRASWESLTLYEGQQAPAFNLCSEVGSKESNQWRWFSGYLTHLLSVD